MSDKIYKQSIPNKLDLHAVYQRFKTPLRYISEIHLKGLEKYPCYGWMNTAVTTDAEPIRNINAAQRHFMTHTMGYPIDPESGESHLAHMCCRLAMTYNYLNFIGNKSNLDFSEISNSNSIEGQLFHPVLIALAKCSILPSSNSFVETTIAFNELQMQKEIKVAPFDIEPTLLEKLIYYAFCYARSETGETCEWLNLKWEQVTSS